MATDNHADRTHARFAPSAASRWMTCRGSIKLAEDLKAKDRESSYAQEGTECHEAASAILEGAPWEKACAGLSEQQQDIVEAHTSYAFDLIDGLHDKGLKPKVWIETRVGEGDFSGTADLAILAGRTLGVIDLKAGHGPVTVRDETGKLNPQLASYAILSLDTHDLWGFVEKVRLTIVQPRVYDEPQTEVVSVDELREFAREITQAITAIENGEASLIPGKHCQFCPARGKCPALRKEAIIKSKMVFDAAVKPREYSIEELVEIANEAELLQTHIDGVMMHIRNELEKGRKIPGWKLVPKRAVAKWTDWETVKADLAVKHKFDTGEMFRLTPRTPNQIQKLLKENGIEFDISPYFVKESSGTTLARESDGRAAVKHNPFKDEDG